MYLSFEVTKHTVHRIRKAAAMNSTTRPAKINLLTGQPFASTTPDWLKQAERATRKHEACCKGCKAQHLKGELNAAGLCRHCADEVL